MTNATIVNVDLLIAETGEGKIADAVSGILTDQMRCYSGAHLSLLDWQHTHKQTPVEIDDEYLPDESPSPFTVHQTAPATQTIWVLSYALPEGNTVRPNSSPDIFTTEADAVAAFDKAMREEWPSNAPCDDDGESLPYPGDPWKAHEAIVDDKAKGDVDEAWGEWNLSSHIIPLPAPMPAAPSPDAMTLLKDLLASYEENSSRWARGDSYETEDRACISEMILRVRALLAGEQSQSPATMAAPITESVHGEPIDGGKAQTINVVSYETSFTAILGAKDDAGAPDIMVELQSDGWHVYIHDGANDDPSYAVILPVEKA